MKHFFKSFKESFQRNFNMEVFQTVNVIFAVGHNNNFKRFARLCKKQLYPGAIDYLFNSNNYWKDDIIKIIVPTQVLNEAQQLFVLNSNQYLLLVNTKKLSVKVQNDLVDLMRNNGSPVSNFITLLNRDDLNKEALKKILCILPSHVVTFYEENGKDLSYLYHLIKENDEEGSVFYWSHKNVEALKKIFSKSDVHAQNLSYPFLTYLTIHTVYVKEAESNLQATDYDFHKEMLNDFGKTLFLDCLQNCQHVLNNFEAFEANFYALNENWFGSFHDLVEATVVLGPDVFEGVK